MVLIVYDAATLTEVKRLPMRKPYGKYNVYKKFTYQLAQATELVLTNTISLKNSICLL
jgi:hypothetical protein